MGSQSPEMSCEMSPQALMTRALWLCLIGGHSAQTGAPEITDMHLSYKEGEALLSALVLDMYHRRSSLFRDTP